jgi:1,2-phenylacetyl-CoA epoxidase catalytic subunit
MCRSGSHEAEKQAMFDKWLRQGLLSFGRPRTEGGNYAISVGLKKRDAAVVMQDFIDDIKPAVKACGLAFPPLARIGIEGGEALDLSLERTDETKAEGYRS